MDEEEEDPRPRERPNRPDFVKVPFLDRRFKKEIDLAGIKWDVKFGSGKYHPYQQISVSSEQIPVGSVYHVEMDVRLPNYLPNRMTFWHVFDNERKSFSIPLGPKLLASEQTLTCIAEESINSENATDPFIRISVNERIWRNKNMQFPFADVVLKVGNEELYVNRNILCSMSTCFAYMMENSRLTFMNHYQVLHVRGIGFEDLYDIIGIVCHGWRFQSVRARYLGLIAEKFGIIMFYLRDETFEDRVREPFATPNEDLIENRPWPNGKIPMECFDVEEESEGFHEEQPRPDTGRPPREGSVPLSPITENYFADNEQEELDLEQEQVDPEQEYSPPYSPRSIPPSTRSSSSSYSYSESDYSRDQWSDDRSSNTASPIEFPAHLFGEFRERHFELNCFEAEEDASSGIRYHLSRHGVWNCYFYKKRLNNQDYLAFGVYGSSFDCTKMQELEMQIKFDGNNTIPRHKRIVRVVSERRNAIGCPNFMPWSEIKNLANAQGIVFIDAKVTVRDYDAPEFHLTLDQILGEKDTFVEVEGHRFTVSKDVLSDASPIFERMFNQSCIPNPSKIYEIENITYEHFLILLDFIYNRTSHIPYAQFDDMILLAQRFEIKFMVDKLVQNFVMLEVLQETNAYKFALRHELKTLMTEYYSAKGVLIRDSTKPISRSLRVHRCREGSERYMDERTGSEMGPSTSNSASSS